MCEKAGISTTGRIESFLTGKKVNRTRYAHLVSLAALSKFRKSAFEESDVTDFDRWKKESISNQYWSQVMQLQVLLFQFVKPSKC